MIGLVCLLLAGSGGSGFFGNLTKGISSGISAVGSGVVSGTKAVGTGVVQGTKVSPKHHLNHLCLLFDTAL